MPRARHQEGRNRFHREPNAEISRTPESVHRRECRQDQPQWSGVVSRRGRPARRISLADLVRTARFGFHKVARRRTMAGKQKTHRRFLAMGYKCLFVNNSTCDRQSASDCRAQPGGLLRRRLQAGDDWIHCDCRTLNQHWRRSTNFCAGSPLNTQGAGNGSLTFFISLPAMPNGSRGSRILTNSFQ